MKDGGAILLAPLLACGDAPPAPEWASLNKSDDGTSESFVDVSNIRITGSMRSAWIKRVYAKRTRTLRSMHRGLERFPKPHRLFDLWVGSDVACMSYNCATNQASVGKMTWYFETGEHYTDTLPTPWFDVKLGTTTAFIMTAVCAWKST
jgi:hypothetical protein